MERMITGRDPVMRSYLAERRGSRDAADAAQRDVARAEAKVSRLKAQLASAEESLRTYRRIAGRMEISA